MSTTQHDSSLTHERIASMTFQKNADSLSSKGESSPVIKREHDSESLSTKERLDEIKIEDTPSSPKANNVWRISVTYQQKSERVCWYGEEPTLQAIEDTLRQTFNLAPHTTLNLRNNEGDIVAISSKLPSQEQFLLEATDNKHEGYSSDYYSRSDSSAPSTPDSCLSDNASPRHTPPLVFADTKSRFDRHHARAEEDYSNKRDAEDDLANKKKRKRRKANEIDRAYKCTLGTCRKIYGSENALKMHIKLKHPDQPNISSHPPYHAAVNAPYNVFMQSHPNNAYPGYPVAQHPVHPTQTSPSRPTSAFPALAPQQYSASAMMPAFFYPTPPERLLLRSQSASSLPVQRPSFADSFNPPALIREPTSSKHNLPSIHSLPTLQPSHLPTMPYSRSAPSIGNSLFGARGFKEDEMCIPQARAAAW